MLTRADADAPFKDALDKALLSFRCSPDPDIERFLHEDAIPYYKRKLCSVYLLLNEEAFFDGRLQIDAYFTLSHKSIIAEEVETSNTQKKKVTGGFADKPILEFVGDGSLVGCVGIQDGKSRFENLQCKSVYLAGRRYNGVSNGQAEVVGCNAAYLFYVVCQHFLAIGLKGGNEAV